MGIETVLFMAFAGMQAISALTSAQNQAKAAVAQGNIAMENKAKETRYRAARQTVSFLNSGLDMEGTPSLVVDETYTTGLKDIRAIGANANAQSKNFIAQGRSEAISAIMGGMKGLPSGSMGSMFETAGSYLPESSLYSLNNMGFGESAYNMLELKDQRAGLY
jgi:hypothetical protein